MELEWDEEKRRLNLQNHGLDLADVGEVFRGPVLTDADVREDYGEDRTVGVGFLRGLVVVLIFAEPSPDRVRVISLRKALSHERQSFETFLRDQLG